MVQIFALYLSLFFIITPPLLLVSKLLGVGDHSPTLGPSVPPSPWLWESHSTCSKLKGTVAEPAQERAVCGSGAVRRGAGSLGPTWQCSPAGTQEEKVSADFLCSSPTARGGAPGP